MKRITLLASLLLAFVQTQASITYDFSRNEPKNSDFTTKWASKIKERIGRAHV